MFFYVLETTEMTEHPAELCSWRPGRLPLGSQMTDSLFASCPEHGSFLCTGAASLSALVVSSDWPLSRLISLYCISDIEHFIVSLR